MRNIFFVQLNNHQLSGEQKQIVSLKRMTERERVEARPKLGRDDRHVIANTIAF